MWTWVSTSDSKTDNSNNQYQVIDADIGQVIVHVLTHLVFTLTLWR